MIKYIERDMPVEKRLFLGIKQMTKTAFSELQDSEKVGYLWFVRCEDPVHFEIYLGTKKYGETNETVEYLIHEIAEKLKVAIGLTDELTLPDDFQYENILDNLEKYGIRITDLEERVTVAEEDIDNLEIRVTNAESDIDNLKSRATSAETRIEILENSVSELSGSVIAIDERLVEAESDIDTLESRATSAETRIEILENIVSEFSGSVIDIESKIPEDASQENQLADKQYVLDLIHSTSSSFRGNWGTWDDVPTNSDEYPEDGEGNRIPRQGDYIVIADASEYVGENSGETYEGTWRFVYEGDWEDSGKNGWKPEYQINEKPEITIYFRKKKEGENISTPITEVKVSDKNTLLSYPELNYSEFVNGGYWDTNITDLRNVSASTTVFYVTPFMTSSDNRILLKICYDNGWSSSPDYITINEAESITDEMVAEAAKNLTVIEDENGNIIPVFDNIIYQEDEETNIVMTSYNLFDGLCWDKNANEYQIRNCFCYSKDGVRYNFSEVNYGNCFYELESWTELPYFTGITKLGDGETYRVFLDYSRIRDIILDVNTLPAYTLFRCTHLENIYIPSGLTDIETYALASCDGLQSLIVNENNPKYTSRNSQGVECNCIIEKPTRRVSALTLIQGCNVSILPDNIKHIASGAFDECTRLTSITLPDGLLSMGDNVFRGCIALNGNVVVPNTVESIGESTFRGCTSLNGININVPVISNYLFKDCSNLSSLTLGDSVTEISKQAFMNCSSLSSVTIPVNVATIGVSTFSGCLSLETVDLTNNQNKVTLSNSNAFYNCTSLSSIMVPDNKIDVYKQSQDWYEYREIIFGTSIYTITFDSVGGDITPSVQELRCGAYIENPGTVHKDLYEFEYWEDEDGNEWNFEDDYAIDDMTLYAHYREVKAIMVKSISNDVTNISMSYNGNYPANVEYSYDGLNWYNIWNNNDLTISLSEGYSDYVYFRGYNPDGFSRNGRNYTWFNINNGQCNLLGNIMYLKDYNQELNIVGNSEFLKLFEYCYAIVDARKLVLPATTLANECYNSMFLGCSNLTTISLNMLQTTSLEYMCYRGMFQDCSSLTTAPELPATTLASDCYQSMFGGCSSLTTAPELPATTLAPYCYQNMFVGCTSLTTAPELPATTLSYQCYRYMFYNCSRLNYIKCLATDISASNCTTYWVYGVANQGIFVQDSSASWDRGVNGIPTNWNVEYTPIDNYITFTSQQNDSTIGLTRLSSNQKLLYSNDNGNTWRVFDTSVSLTVNSGNSVFVGGRLSGNNASSDYSQFSITGNVSVNGNLNSLWNYNDLEQPLYQYCGNGLFSGCTGLVDTSGLTLGTSATTLAVRCYQSMFQGCSSLTAAPELPATALTEYCYYSMFHGCSSLTAAPELPATTLTNGCYFSMFNSCSSLTAAPELPATTLTNGCYQSMFSNCSSLTTAPELPAITLAQSCYSWMFNGCTSLTTAPELPATTLANNCYANMFRNCTSLTSAPELPATTLANTCYNSMFVGCRNLTTAPELPATTLAYQCYGSMFENCTSLTTAPELPATTLANLCYSSMFYGCTSLVTAPELPATTLANRCYYGMFQGCSSLSRMACMAVRNINEDNTYNWMSGVASSGIFEKNPSVSESTWGRGASGIPTNWTVEDAVIE